MAIASSVSAKTRTASLTILKKSTTGYETVQAQRQSQKMLRLISATPSPYARKVRIALAEKSIPFELVTEVPWDSTTQTPQYNPLEKLPVLILDNGKSVYESHYILEFIETKYADALRLLPKNDVDGALFAKQVEVVADGICDALVLLFFEKQRDDGKRSEEWMARQRRKVDGGLKALAEWIGDRKFFVNDAFGLADIAAGSVLGYLKARFPEHSWRETYPCLARYSEDLEERQSFKNTVPRPQQINDKIV
ncbi:MAG: hypothetical protein Q9161_007431 [Pseudevernia consocians]